MELLGASALTVVGCVMAVCAHGEAARTRSTQEREQHIRRLHDAHKQVHAGDIKHHQRHCLRRSRETFQNQEGRHFMQILSSS
jgi:hypothetical protein